MTTEEFKATYYHGKTQIVTNTLKGASRALELKLLATISPPNVGDNDAKYTITLKRGN